MAKRLTPEEKARELLLAHLSPAQKDCFVANNYFDCIGSETGRRYRIDLGASGYRHILFRNVSWVLFGKEIARYCSEPDYRFMLPKFDKMLTQKLAIETNEKYFLSNANRHMNDGPIVLSLLLAGLTIMTAAMTTFAIFS